MFYQNLLEEKETIVDVIMASLVHDIKYEYQDQEHLRGEGIISKYMTYYRVINQISLYDTQSRNIADSERNHVGTITQDPDVLLALSLARPTTKIIQFDEQNLAIRSVAPILRGSKIVAAVVMDVSIQDIDESLAAIDRRIGLILAVTVAVASLAIMAMLGKSIMPRLKRLINVTREIAAGDYKIRLGDTQTDEIGRLAQAFDMMTTELEKSKNALEDYHAKNLEQKVRELDRAYEELKNAQSQLVHNEKMASLGALIAGIAHEINTPIGAISNVSRSIEKRVQLLPELLEDFGDSINYPVHNAIACLAELIESTRGVHQFPTRKEIQLVEEMLHQAEIDGWREKAAALVNLNFYQPEKIQRYLNCLHNATLFRVIEAVASIAQAAKISETSCNKIQEIIQALRYYAYLDKDKVALIQVNDSIRTASVLLRSKLKHRADLILDLDPDLPLIPCTSEIHQIWTNLLSNAYDAIEEKGDDFRGKIIVTSSSIPDHVMVTVSDDGNGIAEDMTNNIFDPFFTTKDIGKGTGLGLSIVSGIVRRHNGVIRVRQRGDPTIFEVLLPITGIAVHQRKKEQMGFSDHLIMKA